MSTLLGGVVHRNGNPLPALLYCSVCDQTFTHGRPEVAYSLWSSHVCRGTGLAWAAKLIRRVRGGR